MAEKSVTSDKASPRETASLLVVDDNPFNLDLLSRRLRNLGFDVTPATGGREALDLIKVRSFDLVLLDIMMPDINGLQVLAALRARFALAALPVIMVSALDESSDIVRALELGANDYVTKPIDHSILRARIRTQLELQRLARQKDEFLSIASHDLKNPLAEILGVAAFVQASAAPGVPLTEAAFALLGNITLAARTMQALVEDFLDFQALDEGALLLQDDAIDLAALAREAVAAERQHAMRKGITLKIEGAAGPAMMRGDRRRLAQVTRNLVENAIKYGPQGTIVIVRTSADGNRAVLQVTDNGPGLRAEDLPRIFQRYARSANRPTGGEQSTGLGLAISKQFVEAHSGRIGVANNPTGGATFWVDFPSTCAEIREELVG